MLTRRKRHWATLLAIGLPLLVGGCATGGMPTPPGSPPGQTSAAPTNAFALAERLRAEGNVSSAVSMYQQAHQANPSDIRPLLGLGDCLLAMSANGDAAQAYGSALAIDPGNLEALRGLGHARILLGQPQFAVAQYQTAVKIAPKDIRSLNGLGVAQDQVGDHAAAQRTYKQILALDPSNQSAKNNLALSLALSGDNAGAIKILEELSKSAGSTTLNRQNLALVYGVSGQLDQARQVSSADLPADAVDRNIATMRASNDATSQQQLLKQSLGVELKGRQYAASAKPIMPLTNLAQASVDDKPIYLSGMNGDAMPVITTGKQTQTATATSVELKTKTIAKRSTGDDWSDEWDEELVDATDVGNGTQTAAVDKSADEPTPAAPVQASKPSPFLSSSNALADDKAPAAAAETKTTPVATASAAQETARATPAAVPTEEPAATTAAKTEPTTLVPTTETAANPTTVASASPAVTTTQVAAAKIYTVQLASYRSEAEATAGWQTLTTEQKDLLATLPHAVAKADLGADKGIYYRLQAGSFNDRQSAKALCSDLQTRSIDCMVVEATSAETPAPAKTQQSMVTPNSSFVIGAR